MQVRADVMCVFGKKWGLSWSPMKRKGTGRALILKLHSFQFSKKNENVCKNEKRLSKGCKYIASNALLSIIIQYYMTKRNTALLYMRNISHSLN